MVVFSKKGTCFPPRIKRYEWHMYPEVFQVEPATNWISSDWLWAEKDEQNALECLKNKSWKHPTVFSLVLRDLVLSRNLRH
jgi:hypothetical protein